MRANAEIALEYSRLHPGWRSNQLVVDAIAERVEEVSEVAKARFPRVRRGDYPSIGWTQIAGMRDRLVHDYGNIDLAILDDVVNVRLPRLIAAIDEVLGESA
jgi:uncharacterized protein with HEPN domain